MGEEPSDPDEDPDVDALLAELHELLAATQERPVERAAARWIGEAEAVAGDLARSDLEPAVLEERLDHVRSLLGEVEDTQDAEAEAAVERARTLTERALAAVDQA